MDSGDSEKLVLQFIIEKGYGPTLAKRNDAVDKAQEKPGRSFKCLLPLMSHVNKLKCSSNDVWQHMQRLLMWEVHPSLGVLESHWSHSHRHVAPSWLTSATQNPVPSQTKYRPFIINHMACPNWYPVGKASLGQITENPLLRQIIPKDRRFSVKDQPSSFPGMWRVRRILVCWVKLLYLSPPAWLWLRLSYSKTINFLSIGI